MNNELNQLHSDRFTLTSNLVALRETQINDDIRAKEVRLVEEDGEMIGVVSLDEAKNKALTKNLDLVMISPNADPPVCKIMDYGKYTFEKAKRDKDTKKKQKIVEMKEIRLSPSIEEHDFNFKVKNAVKFLSAGDKVKVTIRFKGREINYTSLGRTVLDKFAESIEEVGQVDKQPKMEGKSMIMILNPK